MSALVNRRTFGPAYQANNQGMGDRGRVVVGIGKREVGGAVDHGENAIAPVAAERFGKGALYRLPIDSNGSVVAKATLVNYPIVGQAHANSGAKCNIQNSLIVLMDKHGL